MRYQALVLISLCCHAEAFVPPVAKQKEHKWDSLSATVAAPGEQSSPSSPGSPSDGDSNSLLTSVILQQLELVATASQDYVEMFDLSESEVGFYGIFDAIRRSGIALGLKGQPFVARNQDITKALNLSSNPFDKFFTMTDLSKALEDDFLDAARGSTDNRKGWKVRLAESCRKRQSYR